MANVMFHWELAASCLFYRAAVACHESTTIPWQVNLIRSIFVCACVRACVRACVCACVCACTVCRAGEGWEREREGGIESFFFTDVHFLSAPSQPLHSIMGNAQVAWLALGGHTCRQVCAQMFRLKFVLINIPVNTREEDWMQGQKPLVLLWHGLES